MISPKGFAMILPTSLLIEICIFVAVVAVVVALCACAKKSKPHTDRIADSASSIPDSCYIRTAPSISAERSLVGDSNTSSDLKSARSIKEIDSAAQSGKNVKKTTDRLKSAMAIETVKSDKLNYVIFQPKISCQKTSTTATIDNFALPQLSTCVDAAPMTDRRFHQRRQSTPVFSHSELTGYDACLSCMLKRHESEELPPAIGESRSVSSCSSSRVSHKYSPSVELLPTAEKSSSSLGPTENVSPTNYRRNFDSEKSVEQSPMSESLKSHSISTSQQLASTNPSSRSISKAERCDSFSVPSTSLTLMSESHSSESSKSSKSDSRIIVPNLPLQLA